MILTAQALFGRFDAIFYLCCPECGTPLALPVVDGVALPPCLVDTSGTLSRALKLGSRGTTVVALTFACRRVAAYSFTSPVKIEL